MVSVHPNSQPGQRFNHFYNVELGGDSMPTMRPEQNNCFPASFWSDRTGTAAGVEDFSMKVRKPYTITKSREKWTEMEHQKFLEALHLFDRDWKKIKAYVGSKTVIQIRSHAQKYFMKIQKDGMSEHVPPPRPKRKAAHPYPQKAPKKVAKPLSSTALLDSKYAVGPQSMSVTRNVIGSKPLHPWTSMAPTGCASPVSRDDFALSGGSMNWSSDSNDVAPHRWASNETDSQVKEKPIGKRANYIRKESIRFLPEELIAALPDFAQVYRYIGSLFDPSARDQLEELKKMDPIDIETVLMLMDNLSVNLVSPEFDNHRKLLSSYNIDIQNEHTGSEASLL